jgi:hypothetical protein
MEASKPARSCSAKSFAAAGTIRCSPEAARVSGSPHREAPCSCPCYGPRSTVLRTRTVMRVVGAVVMDFGRGVVTALIVAFVVSLGVRATGADYAPGDDWGVDVFELDMGGLCIWYADLCWRSTASVANAFPLVLGIA